MCDHTGIYSQTTEICGPWREVTGIDVYRPYSATAGDVNQGNWTLVMPLGANYLGAWTLIVRLKVGSLLLGLGQLVLVVPDIGTQMFSPRVICQKKNIMSVTGFKFTKHQDNHWLFHA